MSSRIAAEPIADQNRPAGAGHTPERALHSHNKRGANSELAQPSRLNRTITAPNPGSETAARAGSGVVLWHAPHPLLVFGAGGRVGATAPASSWVQERRGMSEYLDRVREQLDGGSVSAQALVLLFRAAEEAEERRDLPELEQNPRACPPRRGQGRRTARGGGGAAPV
jgi:hypothetical protein